MLISTALAVRAATSERSAAAMMVIPPMLCPASTARSPAGTTWVRTASRSSASLAVEYPAAVDGRSLRP